MRLHLGRVSLHLGRVSLTLDAYPSFCIDPILTPIKQETLEFSKEIYFMRERFSECHLIWWVWSGGGGMVFRASVTDSWSKILYSEKLHGSGIDTSPTRFTLPPPKPSFAKKT